ncbi:MAG: DUF4292 domain-containing protein [Bernardetiaceae bacterium]|nr:DUF4292 domain-containing protein [Bernardetiaceae bacterium]
MQKYFFSGLKLLSLLSLLLVVATGCRKSNATQSSKLAEKYGIENVDFNYLTSKSRLVYQDENQNLKSGIDVRMQKDSTIWLSARPMLGIEAMRMLVRRDSIFMIDKINKTYSAMNFEQLSARAGANLNFDRLQAILLGNMPIWDEATGIIRETEGENFVLKTQENDWEVLMRVSRSHRKLSFLEIMLPNTPNFMRVNYANFVDVDKYKIPHEIETDISFLQKGAVSTARFEIEHKKITLTNEQLTFPFSIPSGYKERVF